MTFKEILEKYGVTASELSRRSGVSDFDPEYVRKRKVEMPKHADLHVPEDLQGIGHSV